MKIDCKLLVDLGVSNLKLYKISLVFNADEQNNISKQSMLKDKTTFFEAEVWSNSKSTAKEALIWYILESILGDKFSLVLKYYPMHLLQKHYNTIEKSENYEGYEGYDDSLVSDRKLSKEAVSEQNLIINKERQTTNGFREQAKCSSVGSQDICIHCYLLY